MLTEVDALISHAEELNDELIPTRCTTDFPLLRTEAPRARPRRARELPRARKAEFTQGSSLCSFLDPIISAAASTRTLVSLNSKLTSSSQSANLD